MPIGGAAVLLARGDHGRAAAADRGFAQAAELGRVQGLHQAGIRAGRLVVGQDRAKLDVLGLEQVEDHPVVSLGLAGEVQMRIARVIAERGHRRGALEDQLDRVRPAGGRLDRLHHRPVLEALPGLDANRPGRGGDLDGPGRVEEPAQVADRRLPLTVSLAGLRPLAGQAVGGERVRLGLVEVPIGPDDVEPARRRPAGLAIADRDPDPRRLRPRGRPRLAWLGVAGRREDQGLVVRRRAPRGDQDGQPGGQHDPARRPAAGRPARDLAASIVSSHDCQID